MGTIFGWFSKTIHFISCLIATSLPITGVIIWLNKLKKKPKKKKKPLKV
ncbi:PepSY domain-containing protein [Aequorivita sp. CIP111184]|nr:PepSY domain-containing protein [Aequorivita sp. CIP111184]